MRKASAPKKRKLVKHTNTKQVEMSQKTISGVEMMSNSCEKLACILGAGQYRITNKNPKNDDPTAIDPFATSEVNVSSYELFSYDKYCSKNNKDSKLFNCSCSTDKRSSKINYSSFKMLLFLFFFVTSFHGLY